jgi:G3E family GTPase
MTTDNSLRAARGIAVTLITSDHPSAGDAVAVALGGAEDGQRGAVIESSHASSAEFAVELADHLARDSASRSAGTSIMLLDDEADIVEVSLVLEYTLRARRTAAPVAIQDIVAVTTVAEVMVLLFGLPTFASDSERRTSDDLSAAGRLAARLEFATMIVFADSITTDEPPGAALVKAFLARLSPMAQVVSLDAVAEARARSPRPLATGRAHRLGATMGWQLELDESKPSFVGHNPVESFVFRDPRPFHPGRLHTAVAEHLVPDRVGRIIRSRGFVRLATRADRVGSWSTAGDVLDLDPTGMISWHVESPPGQEIVFFALDLDHERLDHVLRDCLLTDDELIAGPERWEQFADPFPRWPAPHAHRS